MFYRPDANDHGLPFNPFKACVVPRPIGWISTVDATGRVNLAPFSQANMVGSDPPYVMFSAGGADDGVRLKDSVTNAKATGAFVFNMATHDLRDAVNLSGQIVDPAVDELAAAGLTAAPSRIVAPPRVADSPVNLECVLHDTLALPGNTWAGTFTIVIGRVVGVHIRDDAFTADGRLDVARLRPLARLGYMDYTAVERVFEMGALDPADAEKWRKAMGG
ncbi:MAG: flavin reductase family protein [Rhodospirillaceae bacterium]|nr:flavin reductase family protein [Rhodospirillaceae bacterium]